MVKEWLQASLLLGQSKNIHSNHFSSTFFLEFLPSTISQVKERRGIRLKRKKKTIFTGKMVIYVENPTESTKKASRTIKSVFQGLKIEDK